MIPPQIPLADVERVAVLRRLSLLDTPPEERFDRITRLAATIFDVPIVAINLIDAERQWTKSASIQGTLEFPRTISLCAHTVATGRLLEVPDTWLDERFHDNPFSTANPPVRFYAGQPIFTSTGYCLGTLCLADGHPRQLDEKARAILSQLAALVESEIEVNRLNVVQQELRANLESAERLARIDSLTQLLNRQTIMELLELEMHRACQQARCIGVMMVDLDHFKGINDTYGHPTGDIAIQMAATMLSKLLRSTDGVGRYGGEEFLAVLPGCGGKAAFHVADKVRRQLEASPLLIEGQPLKLTASFGVAVSCNPCSTAVADLVLAADLALLKAKRQGRNQVVLTTF